MTEHSAGADNSADQEAIHGSDRLSRLYLEALRAADGPGAYRTASDALEQGLSLAQLYQRVIAPAMHEIGRLWEAGALTVADEHFATQLTNRVLEALRPPPFGPGEPGGAPGAGGLRGKAMIATVQGEQHALGLRMAADVLEEGGYETIYLGPDVPTDSLLQAIASLGPDVLALSATLSELAPRLVDVATVVQASHPRLGLVIGGQAASSQVAGGLPVADLELLLAVAAQPRA